MHSITESSFIPFSALIFRPAVSPLSACCHRAALSFVKEAKKLAETLSQASHATFLHFHSTVVQINVEKKPLRKFNLVIVLASNLAG